ncbi:hypothetical protein ACJ72_02128 [Emergomyces africanus]|uniref:Uncharacterized protein n=1 Tax=Emergomyces africanus TaxID=1955775 RepID=A0A1B7P3C6_9EURO|nr:hypothetical protein ACJ72_02128 [Emergomyces africanus]
MPNPKSPKAMSSRLLTMKFMQRAAAASASASSNPNTGTNTSTNPPATPSPSQQQPYGAINASTPSPKRQKISSPSISTTSTPATGNSDLEAISAAIRAEEEKRAAAVAKQAAAAGEEEWVIEYPPDTFPEPTPQAVMNGGNAYGFGGAGDEEEVMGRQSFGGFKRKGKMGVPMATTSSTHNAYDNNEDEEDVDGRGGGDDDDQDNDGLDALLKHAKLKAEKNRPEKRREHYDKHNKKRKSSDGAVDLSRLTSISGGVDKGEQQRHHQRHHNQQGGGGGGRKGWR